MIEIEFYNELTKDKKTISVKDMNAYKNLETVIVDKESVRDKINELKNKYGSDSQVVEFRY